MKKTSVLLGLCISAFYFAQQGNVGVNTRTPNATLDIHANAVANTSNNEGLLIPRISKIRVAQMVNPETSTLVICE